jgi:hypothetical protein
MLIKKNKTIRELNLGMIVYWNHKIVIEIKQYLGVKEK